MLTKALYLTSNTRNRNITFIKTTNETWKYKQITQTGNREENRLETQS